MRHKTTCGIAVVLVAVSALLFFGSGPAFAHVTVDPTKATVGSETVFAFRVPNEKEDASTVKVEFALPTTKPIPVVSLQPLPGWTAQVTMQKLAKPVQTDDGPVRQVVSRIVWSADKGAAIAPGQFQQFTIEAGPLPKTKLVLFKVLQHYSDGSVVRWIDPPTTGGDEPAHPAPAVSLVQTAAPSGSGGSAAPGSGSTGPDSGDGWIAVAAFVAGLLGLAAGTGALVRVRRNGKPSSHSAVRE